MERIKYLALVAGLSLVVFAIPGMAFAAGEKEHGGEALKEHAGTTVKEHPGITVKEHAGTTVKEHQGTLLEGEALEHAGETIVEKEHAGKTLVGKEHGGKASQGVS